MVTPLRKRSLRTGELYTRISEIEDKLIELEGMSRNDLLARIQIRRRDDPDYVPSECLVYFVRASRADNSTVGFDQLYKVLAERVMRSLPRADSADGKTTSLTNSVIRDKVFGRFTELLSADRCEYSERLDFFEVRFDKALARLRQDAQEQAWRDENRSISLEFDEETGEASEEVEKAASSFHWSLDSDIDSTDYRFRLDAAIDALPPEQIRIIEMLRLGVPIDSQEAGVFTIAKALSKSEKTIRTHRDKAFAAIRSIMSGEEP